MTETAGEVARDILQELVVQGAEADLVADELSTAIRYMNRYMTMLDATGISMGYTVVTTNQSPITIPAGAILPMIKCVAKQLATQFDIPVSQQMHMDARDGYQALCQIAIEIPNQNYPSTLPIGSGNEWDGHDWRKFYPETDEGILDEQGGSILLEDNT